jgi:3-hydroxybutyryl-CoA dehydrogenase
MAPRPHDNAALISGRLRTALLRESIALVERGVATPWAVDTVVSTTIGRRLAVAGPFEIWEQIGWDLVQVIASELLQDISNAVEIPPSLSTLLDHTDGAPPSAVLEHDADPAGAIDQVSVIASKSSRASGVVTRQAISSRAKLSASIWSNGEYLVLPLSPP